MSRICAVSFFSVRGGDYMSVKQEPLRALSEITVYFLWHMAKPICHFSGIVTLLVRRCLHVKANKGVWLYWSSS